MDTTPNDDDFRNPVTVRVLREADLAAIVEIDASVMGRKRTEYYRDKLALALRESRIHLSFVAELKGKVVGFLMTRIYYGEFGRPEPTAVIDAIGVHGEFRGKNVGRTLMDEFINHAKALDVERIRTEVAWNDTALLRFLDHFGYVPGGRIVLERAL